MGCWNHTCSITNLPVSYNEKVAVIMLVDNSALGSSCYHTRDYIAAPFLFYGSYNDYGGVEYCEGSQLDFILGEIRDHLVSVEKDKHRTDGATRENFNPERLFDLDHVHKLRLATQNTFYRSLAGDHDPHIELTHAVVKQNVLDKFLKEYNYTSWMNKDHVYSFDTLVADIPNFIEILKVYYDDEITPFRMKAVPGYDEVKTSVLGTHLYSYFEQSNLFFGLTLGRDIKRLVDDEKIRELTELLTEFAKMSMLTMYIVHSRRAWSKPISASQELDTDAQAFMAQLTLDVIGLQQIEWEKEEFPDDAWDAKRELYIEQCEMELDTK